MPLITQQASAAVAVIQYDLLVNSIHRLSSMDREITGAGLTGSAAKGDTQVDLYVSEVNIASLKNSDTGAGGLTGLQLYPIDADVPAGAELRAVVVEAPASNPITLIIEIDDVFDDDDEADEVLAAMGL